MNLRSNEALERLAFSKSQRKMMLLSLPNVVYFLFFFTSMVSSLNSDGLSLLALKAAIESDPSRSLDKWSESDSTPCHWPGIACTRNRVSSIFLHNKGLTGYIPSELGLLDSLTRLSLSQNNFSKPIPYHLFNATNLIYIDLSHNSLSGSVPPEIKSLKNLTHLDLSSNSLNGSLPESLVELKSLTGTLNLSYNKFSGKIPASYGEFPVMISLDLRQNNLTGKVPQVGSLLNQGPTAFSGNPNLCGFPLGNLCPEAQNPRAILNPEENPENPNGFRPILDDGNGERSKEKNGSVAVPLISGVSVVIGVVSVFVWLFRRKWKSGEGKMGKTKKEQEVDEEGQNGKFVVIDEGFNLELEDLLRASAYVVGKSRSGIVYKVVTGRGSCTVGTTVVAVRRLSEGDATWKFKEFEAEVEAIGRVNHPNVVRLKAYYYANDEKLLVTDFIRNGSLYAALHGGPSNTLPPLSWATRLRIVQGTARGLMYIHEYSPRKYVHGNLKSTKILLDNELQPYISGFGLTRLVSGTSKYTSSASKKLNTTQTIATPAVASRISTPNSYLAPEARVSGSKFTQKCDVYSFGIVLLEILTGRLPDAGPENDDKGLEGLVRKAFREERPLSEIIDPTLLTEVYAKKQVVAAFHIALNCTELDPELRPRMRTVSESLDRIKS
ncbi:receptor protein kinase-like protein ZAR1 [Durio zibethinus]|uniref:Receptor protein kinase-like protein ZAR1 n=1 Tax=Durio zibethinus TaxID=66656 RepID=A0A6P6AMI3_DURZI|nr:receptor protein kinase-like protein ZAR1 [Durio zibethinus]